MKNTKLSKLSKLIERGFDNSKYIGFGRFRVSCSNCEVVFINGIPTHETGCSHAKHECNGCDAIIPINQKYCEDCQL